MVGALVVAILAVYVGDIVVAVDRGSPPSMSTLLRRARRFADRASSARFTAAVDTDGSRGTATGAVGFSDRFHTVSQDSDGFREELYAGGTLYARTADSSRGLAGKHWEVVRGVGSNGAIVRPGEGAGAALGPLRVPAVLHALSHVALAQRVRGGGVLRGQVLPRAAFAGAPAGAPVRVDVTVAKGGRVDRLEYVGGIAGTRIDLDLHFTQWGSHVEIAAPPESSVDRVPDIDVRAVTGYRDVPLLQPAGIPAGWVLEGAQALPPEDTVEGCSQVELDYGDPRHPDQGYLTLFEFPPTCADAVQGGQPFRAGPYQGFVTDNANGVLAQFVAGTTFVQAGSDLPLDDLSVVVGNLRPLDLSRRPDPIPGMGQSQVTA